MSYLAILSRGNDIPPSLSREMSKGYEAQRTSGKKLMQTDTRDSWLIILDYAFVCFVCWDVWDASIFIFYFLCFLSSFDITAVLLHLILLFAISHSFLKTLTPRLNRLQATQSRPPPSVCPLHARLIALHGLSANSYLRQVLLSPLYRWETWASRVLKRPEL